jgi:NADPH-dependent 2,4-dienoyl-CoA reductase/sulfur reductase-like enzyme
MTHYRYLIVGGGMTAAAAVQGIREVDAESPVGLISQEEYPPYNRPPLSKGLWKGKPLEKIFRDVRKPGIDLILSRKVVSLETADKRVTDDSGQVYTYEKLLLATGGSPIQLPFGEDILYYRTLADFKRLQVEAEQKYHFAVIGGGFIGSEIAAALAIKGADVTMLFPEQGIGGRVFPADLSQFVTDYYREKGVLVLSGEMVAEAEKQGSKQVISSEPGGRLVVDRVIAGIGIRPNTALAQEAGLKVDNGVVVDEYLRTSRTDIFAAGDVANFFSPHLGKRLRVEHEDNANTMGKLAGRNMASDDMKAYNHLPAFYSDLFELGYEAVGELDSSLETVSDWTGNPFQKGVVYYLRDELVRGVLLWNVWGKLDEARSLIAEQKRQDKQDLKGWIG